MRIYRDLDEVVRDLRDKANRRRRDAAWDTDAALAVEKYHKLHQVGDHQGASRAIGGHPISHMLSPAQYRARAERFHLVAAGIDLAVDAIVEYQRQVAMRAAEKVLAETEVVK